MRQFESPLVLILVFAAVVSLALRQWVDAGIVIAIVLGSGALGFWQEYDASRAVETLRARLRLTALARRDGRETPVPVGDLVPGDVVLLSAGTLVPADGLVLSARDFQVSEAALTGETFPVEKRPGITAAEAAPAARTNAVFLGTSVRSGSATALILRTGAATEFGAIAQRLRARPPETDFQRGVRQFGTLLMRVMVVIVLFVLTLNLLLGRQVVESLLFAVALAVGLSPELLPGIISVTLSAGAREMGRRGVIVRRLDAIESLGSMDVLCTDKTGTLTEGRVTLRAATDAEGADSAEVMQLAFLNAALETGIANPLDEAIVAAGKDRGLSAAGWEKRGEIPYDFVRRRLTVLVAAPSGAGLMITKGAVAEVLDICTHWQTGADLQPLDPAARAGLEVFFRQKGEEGCRVLALATRTRARRRRPRPHRRTGHDLPRLPGLPRPAQGRCRPDHRRPCPPGHRHQGHQRRQPPCHRASCPQHRAGPRKPADRPGHRRDEGRIALAPGAAHRAVRGNRPAAEGTHRPCAAAHRPFRRLHGRRHQRRARAARRRCRHLGRRRGGCGARKRRHHPSAPRPERAEDRASRMAARPLPTR